MTQQPQSLGFLRQAVALAAGAVLLTTSCGGDDAGTNDAGTNDADTAAAQEALSSPDEVIQIVEKGFNVRRITEGPGYQVDALDHGYVIENVSDEVAIDVRVEATALDADGNRIEGLSLEGTSAFGVIMPGQRLGAGGTTRLDDGEVVSDIDLRVTMIVALDTPDGQSYREPPGPYVDLEMSEPAPDPGRSYDEYTWFAASVTNTYDMDVLPTVKSVLRGADGSIIGGGDSDDATQILSPGASGSVEFRQSSGSPELDGATVEYYAVPQLDMRLTTESVWIDP